MKPGRYGRGLFSSLAVLRPPGDIHHHHATVPVCSCCQIFHGRVLARYGENLWSKTSWQLPALNIYAREEKEVRVYRSSHHESSVHPVLSSVGYLLPPTPVTTGLGNRPLSLSNSRLRSLSSRLHLSSLSRSRSQPRSLSRARLRSRSAWLLGRRGTSGRWRYVLPLPTVFLRLRGDRLSSVLSRSRRFLLPVSRPLRESRSRSLSRLSLGRSRSRSRILRSSSRSRSRSRRLRRLLSSPDSPSESPSSFDQLWPSLELVLGKCSWEYRARSFSLSLSRSRRPRDPLRGRSAAPMPGIMLTSLSFRSCGDGKLLLRGSSDRLPLEVRCLSSLNRSSACEGTGAWIGGTAVGSGTAARPLIDAVVG